MDHIQTLTEHKKIRITGYLNNDPIWIYFVVWIKVVRKKRKKINGPVLEYCMLLTTAGMVNR